MEFESEKIISKFNKGTIVLVHGAYHGPWCWEDNFKPFFVKRGYSVIVVNFSNPNPKVKINDYMEHLNEVVGEISGKVYFISHSLGTAIVEKYITKFSPKLDAVVFLAPSPVIKRLQKAFLVNFHNIMRSKSCFYFSNRLDESVESVYLDKFTDESRQIELLMMLEIKKIWLQKLKTSVKKFHMQPFMQGFPMRVKRTEKEIR